MDLNDKVGVVQDSKAVDNVSAELGINVFRLVFANSRSVPRPIGKVTNNFVLVLCRPSLDWRMSGLGGHGLSSGSCSGGNIRVGNDRVVLLINNNSFNSRMFWLVVAFERYCKFRVCFLFMNKIDGLSYLLCREAHFQGNHKCETSY